MAALPKRLRACAYHAKLHDKAAHHKAPNWHMKMHELEAVTTPPHEQAFQTSYLDRPLGQPSSGGSSTQRNLLSSFHISLKTYSLAHCGVSKQGLWCRTLTGKAGARSARHSYVVALLSLLTLCSATSSGLPLPTLPSHCGFHSYRCALSRFASKSAVSADSPVAASLSAQILPLSMPLPRHFRFPAASALLVALALSLLLRGAQCSDVDCQQP